MLGHNIALSQRRNAIARTYVDALMRDFGARLDLAALAPVDPSARTAEASALPVEDLARLIAALNDEVGRHWPLEAIAAWRSSMHGALEVAVRCSASLADALQIMARYGHVRAPVMQVILSAQGGSSTLHVTPAVALAPDVWNALAETVMLSVTAMVRELCDAPLADATIAFAHARPAHGDALSAMLALPVSFGAARTELRFGPQSLALASPFHDPELLAIVERQLEEQARRLVGDMLCSERVAVLLARSPGKRLSEDDVARHLGYSRRSLVRHLAAEGLSYRQLLDTHLRQRATAMKEAGQMTRDRMAEALGYQDPTSFSRAWKRWFPD